LSEPHLYPKSYPGHDRIPEQLMYLPPDQKSKDTQPKTILLWNGLGSWGGVPTGKDVFQREKCPVNNCEILGDRDHAGKTKDKLKDFNLAP